MRYFVAPETAVHVSFICLSPAVALTFVGVDTFTAAAGVAETTAEALLQVEPSALARTR